MLLTLVCFVVSIVIGSLQSKADSMVSILGMYIISFLFSAFITIGISNFYLMLIEKSGNVSFLDTLISKRKLIKTLIYIFLTSVIIFTITFITIGMILGLILALAFSKLASIFSVFIILLYVILLFIIELSLKLTPYIIIENENLTIIKAMGLSVKMMKGNKWKLFIIELSFIGWAILSILTFAIGFLWLMPYRHLTEANFYKNLILTE